MQIQPLQTFVTAILHDLRKTDLVLPENVGKQLPYLEILAVGEKCAFLSVGDRVLIRPDVPICLGPFGPEGQDLYLISEGSAMAKLTGELNILSTPILN